MSMQLTSEILLKREIERLESNPELRKDELDKIWYAMCKRELVVIERLKINNVDLRGTVEEVAERLKNQSLYFMDAKEFEEMKEKEKKYDKICGIIAK